MTPLRRSPLQLWISLALVAIVFVSAASWHVRRLPQSYPFGDSATTSLYTLKAGHDGLATGAYSRFKWHHPGPLLYQWLAPAYRLSGNHEASIKWSMLALNLVALALLLVVTARRRPLLAASIAAVLTPLIWYEQRLLFWAWNPVAPLMSIAAAIAVAAAVASGTIALLPVLALLLSFIAQSHVGLVPLCAIVAVSATVGLARSSQSDSRRATGARWIAAAAIVTALVWFLPLTSGSANLRQLAVFWAEEHPRQTWTTALNVVATELAVPFSPSRELITTDQPWAPTTLMVVWAVATVPLLAFILAAAWRRRDRFTQSLATICLATVAAAPVVVRSIVGPVSEYLVFWLAIVSAWTIALVVTEVLARFAGDSPRLRPVVRVALACWLFALAPLTAMRIDAKQRDESQDHTPVHLAGAIAAQAARASAPRPLLTFSPGAWAASTGVILQLTKDGQAIAVGEDELYLVGERFRRTGHEAAEFYLMPIEEDAVPAGVSRYEWIATVAGTRLLRLWR